MGSLFVILGSFFYGFSNSYWKRATVETSIFRVIFHRGLISTFFFGSLWLLDVQTNWIGPFFGTLGDFTANQFGITILLCLMSGFGLFFFVKSMQTGVVSLVAPISSLNISALLTATFILGEPWKVSFWIPLVILALGLLFLFYDASIFQLNKEKKRALIYGFLASFIWGIDYTLFKIPLKWMGVLPFTFFLEFCVTSFSFMILLVSKTSLTSKISVNYSKHILILSSCLIAGTIFIHLAYLQTSIIKISFLSQTQLLFTLFFVYFMYDEKLKVKQWFGIILLIISIVLIEVF